MTPLARLRAEPGWLATGLALLVVALVKLVMIVELPWPVFSSDSHTYLRTAHFFWFHDHAISIHPKRAFLYPVLLTLLHPLPGGLGLPLLLLQHTATLLVPLFAVCLLKQWTPLWRWFAAPLVLMVGLNGQLLFYSHYLLADALFTVAYWWFLWRAWLWIDRPGPRPAALLLWATLLCQSLRPDGRMLLLLALGLIALRLLFPPRPAWDRSWLWAALPAAACFALWSASHITQQGWLLYSSVLPLTRLDAGLHSELKAELRPLVERARHQFWNYAEAQDQFQRHLANPSEPSIGPRWDALRSKGQNARLHSICKDLAVEAIVHDPGGYALLIANKIRHVLQRDRERHRELRPERIGDDYREQLADEPAYQAFLFSGDQWARLQVEWAPGRDSSRLTRFLAPIETFSSPKWWSLWGLGAALGWLLAIASRGWRLALWCAASAGLLLGIYAIARGILRYLLPSEPLLPLGLALLLAVMAGAAAHCVTRDRAPSD